MRSKSTPLHRTLKQALVILYLSSASLAIAAENAKPPEQKKATETPSVQTEPSDEPPIKLEAGEYVFRVHDGEANVNDGVINRVIIGKNVVVSFRNRLDEDISPEFTIAFYNRFGHLAGRDEIRTSGFSTLHMQTGEVESEELHFDWFPLAEILKHSDAPHRDAPNLNRVRWVVIRDANWQPLAKPGEQDPPTQQNQENRENREKN